MGIFKTRDEYEEEDNEKYYERLNYIRERKRARWEAEGYKCKVDGCQLGFKDYAEYQVHQKEHYDQLYAAMICNKPKCGIKLETRQKYFAHIESHKEEDKRKILNSIRLDIFSIFIYQRS